MKEEFKPIKGYEGLYSITNLGRIYSHKRKIFLKQRFSKKGYLRISLYLNRILTTYLTHRLVAVAFLPNPDNLPQVNHKDCIKTNNYGGSKENNYKDSNLEWCTNDQNMEHALEHGLTTSNKKYSKYYGVYYDKNCSIRKWNFQMIYNRIRFKKHFKTEIEAAHFYDRFVLSRCLKRPLNFIKK